MPWTALRCPSVSARLEQQTTPGPEGGEKVQVALRNRELQDKGPGMTHEFPRQGKELPPERRQTPALADGREQIPLEALGQAVDQNADPEPDRVGIALSGRHVSDAPIALEPLEEVLELSPLLVLFQDAGGRDVGREVLATTQYR